MRLPISPVDTIRAALIAGALALAGCAEMDSMLGMGPSDGAMVDDPSGPLNPKLAEIAAHPPHYSPGDRFAFSNPDVTWEVVAVEENGEVVWRADNGDVQRTAANPLLPALEWASGATGRGKRLITDMTAEFFPLEVGKEIAFRSTVSSDKPPYAWEFDWNCVIEGRERMAARVGQVDVFKIACGRRRPDEIIFYYAPEVGHYVRLDAAKPSGVGSDQRWLTGYHWASAPPAMRAGDAMMASASDEMMMEEPKPIAPSGDVAPPVSSVEAEAVGSTMDAMAKDQMAKDTMKLDGAMDSDGMAAEADAMALAPATGAESGAAVAGAASGTVAGATAAAAGGLGVHMASYRDPKNAERGWKQLLAKNPAVLDGTRPVIRKVDLGKKGVFYRLHAGPISDKARAETMCKALKAAGQYCAVRTL